jgi:hypothetical protein
MNFASTEHAENCIAKVTKDFTVCLMCLPEPGLGPRGPRFYQVRIKQFDPRKQGGWAHDRTVMLVQSEAIKEFNRYADVCGIARRLTSEDFGRKKHETTV